MLFASIFLLHSVLGDLKSISVDVVYKGDTLNVDPGLYQEHNGERFHKTMNKFPIVFEFKLTNKAAKGSVTIDTRETPLAPEVRSNPFPSTGHVRYLGMIAETKGKPEEEELLQIKAGETKMVKAAFEALAFAEGSDPEIVFEFELVDADGDEERLIVASTHVPLAVASKKLKKPEGYEEKVGAEFSKDIKTGSDGIPYVDPECVDKPENTGFKWSSGGVIPCSSLKDQFNMCASHASVKKWCPVTCGGCGDIGKDWSKPNVLKGPTLTFDSSCTSSTLTLEGVAKTDKEWLLEAEEKKQNICATIIWHIENRSGKFETMYVKWFGGDAKANDARMVRLRDGFIKICSIQNYAYHCNPDTVSPASCKFSATTSDGSTTTTYPSGSTQGQHRSNRQNILENFTSIGGTGAWVWNPVEASTPPRTIHICPIIFYLSNDISDNTADLKSRVGTVFHELAHFNDMGDTTDWSYSNAVMLDGAKGFPGNNKDWMENSANWDNFAEDISQFAKNWADFSGSSSGGGSGGSTPTSTTSTTTTTTSTTTTTTATPTTSTTTSPISGGGSSCTSSQWQCANGQCIKKSWYCDGSSANQNANYGPDCSDGSDEILAECCAANSIYSNKCSKPSCIGNAATWSTSWGKCADYASGKQNHRWCSSDKDSNGDKAKDVCPQCGSCTSPTFEHAAGLQSFFTHDAMSFAVNSMALVGAFTIVATIGKFALHKYHAGNYEEVREQEI